MAQPTVKSKSALRVGVLPWVRANLFATWYDTLFTILVVLAAVTILPSLVQWAFLDATWNGTSRADCNGREGACWVFVQLRVSQFLYGFYPVEQVWRVNVAFAAFVAAGVSSMIRWRWRRQSVLVLATIVPLLSYFLMYGGVLGLPVVETPQWGGLMLTLIIAVVGISGSLPIGTALALGRRSPMPVISRLSVAFIEVCRGVPLITVLFMASVMLPLFLPVGVTVDKLLRALIGVTLFSGAYMAEVVRGGLQAMPKGQYEAAEALGLSYWQIQRTVILPQALKKVIPGIVNTFIGLFKDTTLVLVIGMFDLLGIVQTALTDPEWLGHSAEGYVFAGTLFWVFCFTMSRFSMRLERRLDTDRRERKR